MEMKKEELKEVVGLLMQLSSNNILGEHLNMRNHYNSGNVNEFKKSLTQVKRMNSFIDYSKLSDGQIEFLKKSDLYPYFGEVGNALLTNTFADNALNKGAGVASLDKFRTTISTKLEVIRAINNTFDILPSDIAKDSKEERELPDNMGELEIYFREIKSLEQLSKVAKDWDNLIKMLHKISGEKEPEMILIEDIEKGSLKLKFQALKPVLRNQLIIYNTIVTTIQGSLGLYEDIAKINSSTGLDEKAKNEIVEIIERSYNEKKEKMAEEVYLQVKENLGLTEENENNAKLKSFIIPKTESVVIKGGTFNFYINDEADEINDKINETKLIENNIMETLEELGFEAMPLLELKEAKADMAETA